MAAAVAPASRELTEQGMCWKNKGGLFLFLQVESMHEDFYPCRLAIRGQEFDQMRWFVFPYNQLFCRVNLY